MAGNISNISIGAAQILLGAGATDMGFTAGGVEITIEEMRTQAKIDQLGETTVNEYITGKKCIVKMSLAEGDIDKLPYLFPNLTVSGSTNKKAIFNPDVGIDMLAKAQKLVIKRLSAGPSTDKGTHWRYTFHLAAPKGTLKEKFDFKDQVSYEIEWECYPDSSNSYAFGYRGYDTAS